MMTQPLDILFNLFVVLAFLAALADHYYYGQGYIKKPLRAFLLGCFLFTESYLAVTNPALWLYVSLNIWGLFNLYAGRKVPLRWRRKRK
jgi:hypothetical protein